MTLDRGMKKVTKDSKRHEQRRKARENTKSHMVSFCLSFVFYFSLISLFADSFILQEKKGLVWSPTSFPFGLIVSFLVRERERE
mmetsp:Transcript_64142/g.73622  ORF Transcript_64142/g.73622 Transcript_64142/m.73622 type:complete len:84 (-) Transcript_64142:1048-1299(-)